MREFQIHIPVEVREIEVGQCRRGTKSLFSPS